MEQESGYFKMDQKEKEHLRIMKKMGLIFKLMLIKQKKFRYG